MRRNWNLFLWFIRILEIFVIAWVIVVVGASVTYIQAMLHPACRSSGPIPDGYQTISLHTSDGLDLQGWWRPPDNGVAILLLGGHGGTRADMLAEAEILAGSGYGALLLDGRQCAGAMVTFGYREVADLQAMLDFARAQPAVSRIGALGFSAGSATVLLGAARFTEIQAVIAEGNYVNLFDEMTSVQAPVLSLEWQLQRVVALVYWATTGTWPGTVSPVEALPLISPRPVLLIHGELEIQHTQGQRQFEAARQPKELWIVPGAGHGAYREVAPQEYARRILEFFDRAFIQNPQTQK